MRGSHRSTKLPRGSRLGVHLATAQPYPGRSQGTRDSGGVRGHRGGRNTSLLSTSLARVAKETILLCSSTIPYWVRRPHLSVGTSLSHSPIHRIMPVEAFGFLILRTILTLDCYVDRGSPFCDKVIEVYVELAIVPVKFSLVEFTFHG